MLFIISGEADLSTMYLSILDSHLERFQEPVRKLSQNCVQAAVELHREVVAPRAAARGDEVAALLLAPEHGLRFGVVAQVVAHVLRSTRCGSADRVHPPRNRAGAAQRKLYRVGPNRETWPNTIFD